MRTRSNENQKAAVDLIDQQPIGTEMTFAMSSIFAGQGVVAVSLRQRLFRLQQVDGRPELAYVLLARALLEVFLKARCSSNLQHYSTPSFLKRSEADSKRSSFSGCSASSIAAIVSALGR